MFTELNIDSEFESVIRPMSKEEFDALEKLIVSEGKVIMPIITWNGTIIDGHNRYKIVLKHKEIPFDIIEKEFNCRDEAILWICKMQLSRRNLTTEDRRYLIGKQYQTEKHLETFIGNQYTLKNKFGEDSFCPHQKNHGTRTKISKEHGVSEGYVESATRYSQGIDAAEKVAPGIKKEITSGKIDVTIEEISALRKLPEEELKSPIELIKLPVEMRKFNSDNKAEKQEIQENEREKNKTPIEDSLMITYDGLVKTFVANSNNLLVRFPKLKNEIKYREQILKMLDNLEKYITKAEKYLNNENENNSS